VGIGQGALEDVVVSDQFWRGRRVLVTGHTGFKGAWTALWLQFLGAEVTGVSLPPAPHGSLFDLGALDGKMTSLDVDVLDLAGLTGALRLHEPEIVLHMAAQSLVRPSYLDPAGTFAVNALGTANLLEAVRGTPSVGVVICVTSDKCYDPRSANGNELVEDDRLGGTDPYSASKACAELVVASYRDSFFSGRDGQSVGVATARAGNVIGGGDGSRDRLIPDAFRALSTGQPLEVRYPDAVRPWQHVLCAIHGYLTLAAALWSDRSCSGAWNFGPVGADAAPVREVLAMLEEHLAEPLPWEPQPGWHPPETPTLRLNSAKARERLGWKPAWDLDRALSEVVAWHRAVLGGDDAREVALRQVEQYMASCRAAGDERR
jgi:CDP-glucose 4,6-dehydratase